LEKHTYKYTKISQHCQGKISILCSQLYKNKIFQEANNNLTIIIEFAYSTALSRFFVAFG